MASILHYNERQELVRTHDEGKPCELCPGPAPAVPHPEPPCGNPEPHDRHRLIWEFDDPGPPWCPGVAVPHPETWPEEIAGFWPKANRSEGVAASITEWLKERRYVGRNVTDEERIAWGMLEAAAVALRSTAPQHDAPNDGPAITILRHAAKHIGLIFEEEDANYADLLDRNDLTEYGKDHRRSDKRWGERMQSALEGMALKANQLDVAASQPVHHDALTDEMIEAEGVKRFGIRAEFNRYGFSKGAKWARDHAPVHHDADEQDAYFAFLRSRGWDDLAKIEFTGMDVRAAFVAGRALRSKADSPDEAAQRESDHAHGRRCMAAMRADPSDALAPDLATRLRFLADCGPNLQEAARELLRDVAVAFCSQATTIIDYRDETISLRAEVVEANRALRSLGAKERELTKEQRQAITVAVACLRNQPFFDDGSRRFVVAIQVLDALLDAPAKERCPSCGSDVRVLTCTDTSFHQFPRGIVDGAKERELAAGWRGDTTKGYSTRNQCADELTSLLDAHGAG